MKRTGSRAWRPSRVPGGHPKVDTGYRAALTQTVERAPRDAGLPYSSWTCRDLAIYLSQQGQACVSDETVRRTLHALEYAVLRPVLSIRSPDPAYANKAATLQAYQAQA